ncbi:uncharacterized protein N7496_006013 [Penicillium cataractarum]|uniref:Uncharacterized protein n=1 Tax=Penicillium cataractarum TaxID=2100454 RepID=A0A9W9S0Y6_9EURO|nr:uncharacterized protein N7496_006013 [Penicillium cataractarum]KAJ5369921.1 hypothetical protein N7496_006013 [Penicillium cataractarum]
MGKGGEERTAGLPHDLSLKLREKGNTAVACDAERLGEQLSLAVNLFIDTCNSPVRDVGVELI